MSGTQPLRILHLSNDLSTRGNGIVNVAVDLAIEQVRAGCEVAIGSAGGGYKDLLESHGVRCLYAPQSGAKAVLSNFLRLFRVVRQFRPDMIHTHMRSGLLLAWPIAKLLRIPLVNHLHNIHDRHYNIVRLPDRVIAVSESVGETLAEQGLTRDRIRVVTNGVLGSERRAAAPPSKELQHPAIVTVAGMVHRKGIAELIEAFALLADKHPKAHLYLVGTGAQEEEFQAKAKSLPIAERIHFENYQPDPRSYLRAADVFVLASRRDSCGLVLLEAREEGCAIVGTNIDGMPEVLEHGEAGLLTPVSDSAALATQIDRLLGDDALRRKLGQRARMNLERFSTATMTARTLDVYNEILRNRRPRVSAPTLAQPQINNQA